MERSFLSWYDLFYVYGDMGLEKSRLKKIPARESNDSIMLLDLEQKKRTIIIMAASKIPCLFALRLRYKNAR